MAGKRLRLTRNWDDYGNPMDMAISFKWDLKGSTDPFFPKLTETSYRSISQRLDIRAESGGAAMRRTAGKVSIVKKMAVTAAGVVLWHTTCSGAWAADAGVKHTAEADA